MTEREQTMTKIQTAEAELRNAACAVRNAECALHDAHGTHYDAWISAASDHLHDTLVIYLVALEKMKNVLS